MIYPAALVPALRTSTSVVLQGELEVLENECRNRFGIVQIELWKRSLQRRVAGDRDDVFVVRMDQGLADLRAMHFQLRYALALVAFDEQEIARREMFDLLRQHRLRRAAKLVHERPSP